jgi:hypothetical protein
MKIPKIIRGLSLIILAFIISANVSQFTSATVATDAENGLIKIETLAIEPKYQNPWSPELESEFWQRANQAIQHYAGQNYGDTFAENEKRSYALAMFDFVAGNREKAIAFLQSGDAQSSDHQHTDGIDYYYSFTLKGQIRKYFYFGKYLDQAYKQRMFDAAKKWTEKDPLNRPHPIYANGNGSGNDWDISKRGLWVDSRNTDNLRAMRETAVYLMAEETGNEETRRLYQQKIQRYVGSLYHIGMGEWDSENYHGHTFSAYLNLYDFAKNPEVKLLGKAALDWMSATAAIKYYHGGFGGPTKRDYGSGNVVFGSAAARLFWVYFGDAIVTNPQPERDTIQIITSAYRPPQAVVALARKQFDKPVEIKSTKPIYENWQPGGENQPGYWETIFFGKNYQMGSVVSKFSDADVGTFKLMAANSQRGVDYFVANTGNNWVKPGKNAGDQIGQYQNLLIWLRPTSNTSFFFQLPKTAKAETDANIWFFQLEKVWLAIHPINLSSCINIEITDPKLVQLYRQEQTCRATMLEVGYGGFALEVGEAEVYSSYASFKKEVKEKSQLNLNHISTGTVELIGTNSKHLQLTLNPKNELPFVLYNGVDYDWFKHFDLYQPTNDGVPIALGWKTGTLSVKADGLKFMTTVSPAGRVIF